MPVEALALVLCAAGLHSLWNVLLAGAADIQATTAAALVVGCAALAPAAAVGWHAQPAVVPFACGSAALEIAYFALLTSAYRRAELSFVYPLTRGLAPVLVLGASVVFLGLGSSVGEAVGVGVVAVGIVLVRRPQGRRDPTAAVLVLTIAAIIASYTLIDRYGVRHASALAYLELVLAGPAVVYAAALGPRRVRSVLTRRAAVAGLAMVGAYALVLAALRLASAASVAAVRESGIVIAVGLAALVLREPVGLRRLAGAAFVAAGVALIAVA